jgi:hypothetical protein
MNVQRSDLISSDENDEFSSDGKEVFHKLSSSKDLEKIEALKKIDTILYKFKDKTLKPIDKRLLKGFYV